MSLQIIFGPMFSGKTSQLIDTINNLIIVKKISGLKVNILLINNVQDVRNINRIYNLTTHNEIVRKMCKDNIATVNVADLLSIEDDILKDIDLIAIDECQFFYDLSDFVKKMLKQNKNIICSGLIADINKNKFGQLLDIFPLADTTTQLKAYCVYCVDVYVKTASFTKLKNNKIDFSTNSTHVSDQKDYEPVCGKHF